MIASVSLAMSETDPVAFARALGGSFERHGFAIVSDHGIPADLVADADARARAFFALPAVAKRAFHLPGGGGARGYTPFGIETAKGASAHDLKEFFHVGRELAEDHRYADRMPPNIWPDAEFRATVLALYAAFECAGLRLLAGIARYLRLAPDFFVDAAADGNSVLRLLHYPPLAADARGLRAEAHEDINAITLLLGAQEAGLELQTRDGRWLPIAPQPGELLVNVGDMLARMTNDRLRSTSHRVVNPSPERRGRSRYSMPFFLHFRPDYLIETLPGCVDAAHPARLPITAHDFLMARLREIGLV